MALFMYTEHLLSKFNYYEIHLQTVIDIILEIYYKPCFSVSSVHFP